LVVEKELKWGAVKGQMLGSKWARVWATASVLESERESVVELERLRARGLELLLARE
jgi:hypothetical protein